MQRDKATLAYHGASQLRWAFDLLSQVCTATFISVRPDQREESTRAGFPQIVDRQPGTGPIAGIAAALQEHPKAAWLVLACDLPFLTAQTLAHLLEHRNPRAIATAYRSSHDGLPEPLCAIWEPSARAPVLAHIAAGEQCPRKLLINSNASLLDPLDGRALDNVNTPEEFSAAANTFKTEDRTQATDNSQRSGRAATISVRVQYYAILREQAGRSEETLDTTAATPADLFAELRQRHPFQLSPAQLKVALNSEFSDWQTRLRHGDTIVFIPPVAGG